MVTIGPAEFRTWIVENNQDTEAETAARKRASGNRAGETTTAVLLPPYRTQSVGLYQPLTQLRTRGFCWSEVLLIACPCWLTTSTFWTREKTQECSSQRCYLHCLLRTFANSLQCKWKLSARCLVHTERVGDVVASKSRHKGSHKSDLDGQLSVLCSLSVQPSVNCYCLRLLIAGAK